MDVRKRVGLNIQKFRKELRLSQEDLALDCDIHRTYISGLERGIRNPTVTVLEKVAKGLKVPSYRLLQDERPVHK